MKTVTRKTRKRERPLGVAVATSLIISLLIGLTISVILINTPHTPENYFFLLRAYDGTSTLPSTPLYQELYAKCSHDDSLFVIPATLFCGGLALGLLAPRSAGRRRTLRAGAFVGLGVLGISLGFLYIDVLVQAVQSKQPRHLDMHGLLMEGLGVFVWALICVLGTWIGLLVRDARHRKDGQTPASQPLTAASR